MNTLNAVSSQPRAVHSSMIVLSSSRSRKRCCSLVAMSTRVTISAKADDFGFCSRSRASVSLVESSCCSDSF